MVNGKYDCKEIVKREREREIIRQVLKVSIKR